MISTELAAVLAFLLISIFFFAVGSRVIVFHLVCVILIAAFVNWTGKRLSPESISEWIIYITGLLLYWFGLTIVRIMLTRSVSLRMLADISTKSSTTTSEGIAARLQDMQTFGLLNISESNCRLTPFGKLIAFIVTLSYGVLGIK